MELPRHTLLAALDWQLAMGADESTLDVPPDWASFAPPGWWIDAVRGRPTSQAANQAAEAQAPAYASNAAKPPITPIFSEAAQQAGQPAQPTGQPAPQNGAPLTLPVNVTVHAQTLAELEAEFKAFEGCGLKASAIQFVAAEGNAASRIMIIGDTPGADEDRAGRPFAGRGGKLLGRMLAAIGLNSRDDYYIMHAFPWRPPGNRTPTDSEIAVLTPFLKRAIELVQPRLIIAFGALPVKMLLQHKEGISRLRGKELSLEIAATGDANAGASTTSIPLFPLLQPDVLLTNMPQKQAAWADLVQIKKALLKANLLKNNET